MEHILDLKLEGDYVHLNLYDDNEFLVLNMKWDRRGEADIKYRDISIKDNKHYDFDIPRNLKLGDIIKLKVRTSHGVVIPVLIDFLENIEFPYYPKVLYFLIVHIDLDIFSKYYSTGELIDWDILLNYLDVNKSDFLLEKPFDFDHELKLNHADNYSFEELFVFTSLLDLFINELKSDGAITSGEIKTIEAKLRSDTDSYKLPLVINYLKLSRKGPRDSYWYKNMITIMDIVDKNSKDINIVFTLFEFINTVYFKENAKFDKKEMEVYLR